MDLKFYLAEANAARDVTLIIPESLPREYQDRENLFRPFAQQLKGTAFYRETRSKVVLATQTVERLLAARAYLTVFERIVRAKDQKATQLDLRFAGVDRVVYLDPRGKVRVSSTPVYQRYCEFIQDLASFDWNRIKQCRECRDFFEGRQNSKACSNRCKQKYWRVTNPDAYDAIQKRHEAKRARKRGTTQALPSQPPATRI